MIKLQGISKVYTLNHEHQPFYVLKEIDLQIRKKEFTAIMGPSGAGKSSLVNIISFLDKQFLGTYEFEGSDVRQLSDKSLSKLRNQHVGFVFQSFNLIDSYTIYENVELPLLYSGLSHKRAQPIVLNQLEKVGLLTKKKQYPTQLSGGQKQRVAIARALANNPSFIVADEPTGALDSQTSGDILSLFKKLNEQHAVTILMVTHDNEAAKYCKRVIQVKDGSVVG